MIGPREGTYHYVRWPEVEAWLRLGWMPAADLGPTHGEWSTLLYWACDCPVPFIAFQDDAAA
jgi:hypothetical protein